MVELVSRHHQFNNVIIQLLNKYEPSNRRNVIKNFPWRKRPLGAQAVVRSHCAGRARGASRGGNRAARTDGIWQGQPRAHVENFAALRGFAARHRNRGQRGKNQFVSPDARQNDGRRIGDDGKGQGAALSVG